MTENDCAVVTLCEEAKSEKDCKSVSAFSNFLWKTM